MGKIVAFPGGSETGSEALHHDPYYQFIRSVLTTANACGFSLPASLDAAVEDTYQNTRHTSQLARILLKAR